MVIDDPAGYGERSTLLSVIHPLALSPPQVLGLVEPKESLSENPVHGAPQRAGGWSRVLSPRQRSWYRGR